MRAAWLEKIQEPVIIKEVDEPSPEANEVLIRVKYAAVNRRDVWIQKGQYSGRREKLILGSDGAGIVEAAGKSADPSWVGQEVVINPSLNWGADPGVQGPDFKILGNPDYGTFAGYVAVPADHVHPKPGHLGLDEAAAIPLAGLTAYRAVMVRGRLKENEKVLITGAGAGTASFALQLALAAGAEVYVTSGSDEKIKRAVELGAKAGFNYRQDDWSRQVKEASGGIDLAIDSAGGEGFGRLVEIANPGGRIVNFGQTAGSIREIATRHLFWKQLSILGTTMGTPQDFTDFLDFYSAHQLKPVIDVIFPLAETEQAFRRMEENKQFGKIVLKL